MFYFTSKIVSEYDQEIPQSQTADKLNPVQISLTRKSSYNYISLNDRKGDEYLFTQPQIYFYGLFSNTFYPQMFILAGPHWSRPKRKYFRYSMFAHKWTNRHPH